MSLQALVKSGDIFLMEPSELAWPVLVELKAKRPRGQHPIINIRDYVTHPTYRHDQTHDIQLLIMSAIEWLKAENLIATYVIAPTHIFITKKGDAINTTEDVKNYQKASLISRELIHPSIAEEVWANFIRGAYDTAVFRAFKQVEVDVRNACGWPADNEHLGVKLMRKAFSTENGPLTDNTAERGEQVALMELFAGAIGSYKNPHSHRSVDVNDPQEAGEMIYLASHLLRIVETRAITLREG